MRVKLTTGRAKNDVFKRDKVRNYSSVIKSGYVRNKNDLILL